MGEYQKSRGFRPWPDNAKRLEYAEMLGKTTSEVINEVLQEHLKDYVERLRLQKAEQIRSVLSQPVP